MTRDAGVVRSAEGLERAGAALATLVPGGAEERNLLAVSRALVRAATARCESRGTHTRSDHPATSPEFLGRFVFSGASDPQLVPLVGAAERTGA
jgi:L-aspartate oxidase